jgi:hypothetical protein
VNISDGSGMTYDTVNISDGSRMTDMIHSTYIPLLSDMLTVPYLSFHFHVICWVYHICHSTSIWYVECIIYVIPLPSDMLTVSYLSFHFHPIRWKWNDRYDRVNISDGSGITSDTVNISDGSGMRVTLSYLSVSVIESEPVPQPQARGLLTIHLRYYQCICTQAYLSLRHRQWSFFNNVCHQDESSIEKKLAVRQLTVKADSSNSWFICINNILRKYDMVFYQ